MKLYNSLPNIIESDIKMEKANSMIDIHEGEYILLHNNININVVGRIYFYWFPSPNVYFSGILTSKNLEITEIIDSSESFTIIVNELEFGEGLITNTTISNNDDLKIKGISPHQSVLGDKTISVEKITFCIPNLRNFFGDSVKKISQKSKYSGRNRIKLENEKYNILIDKSITYGTLRDELKENGGYHILYNGEITSKKKTITFEELNDVFHCLDTFMTFLNGSRVCALFATGYFENKAIWTNYSYHHVDIFKYYPSWPQDFSIIGIEDIWVKFSNLWKDKENKDFLTSVVHWYVEANKNSGFVEGAIII
ncbi:hypothetical protein V8G69_12480 [Gaetbulibacter sp. M235]|uniref:hypothetical protein n=1 Tax=Gaetbulibacter sp. M235 TaxID=3126510 RepID=UPI00374E2B77